MRIYTKKAFRFSHPSNAESPVQTRALNFSDVPDWVADTVLFKWASADGDVNVIESKMDESKVEQEANEKPKRTNKAASGE